MKNNAHIYLIVIWLVYTIPSFSQMTKIDSLLLAIDSSTGEKKLELLNELTILQKDTKDLFSSADRLGQEADRQGSKKYKVRSYEFKARYYLYKNDADSVLYFSNLINDLYDEYNKEYFLINLYLAQMYINQGYYDLAIYNLHRLLKNVDDSENKYAAYHVLGMAYMASGRYTTAKDSFIKALDLHQENNLDPSKKVALYDALLVAIVMLNEFDLALKYCSEFDAHIQQHKETYTEAALNTYLFILYNVYINIYTNLNDVEKVNFYFDKFKALSMDGMLDHFKQMRSSTYSVYYLFMGDTGKALSYIEEPLSYFKKANSSKSILDGLRKMKIEILEQKGNYKEAFFIQQELTNDLDSMYQENVPLQITEITKKVELEKAQVEQQKAEIELENSRIIIIGLIVVSLLLCFIIFLFRRNAYKMKEKNKVLFKKYEEADRYIGAIENHNKPHETKDELSLFDRIDLYMRSGEIFRNPNITREDVAAALNTNRQYLTDAIKSETGKTFLEYVNHFRLSYARRQLMSDDSIPVNNIIIDSGFPSVPTFYRLFKDEFGMSPNELRQAKVELKQRT